MTRVLFVTLISDMSRPTGYRTRVLSEMEAVRSRGVEPRLVALSPPQLVLRRRARAAFQRELTRRGLVGALAPHPPSLGTRTGRRLMLRYSGGVVGRAARNFGADVVHAHGPYAAAVAFAAGRPVIFDAHGSSADEFAANGRAAGWSTDRYAWEVGLIRELERRAWSGAHAVVTVSNALIDYLSAAYGPRASASVMRVPCAVSETAFVSPGTRERVRAELGLGQRPVFVYVGSLAAYQLAPAMLTLVLRVRQARPEAMLLVISQAAPGQWHGLAESAGLSPDGYVVTHAEGERVAALASAGDVALMLREEAPVNAVAFPTKLGEYLAAGVPVLTTKATRDPAEFIQRERVGCVVHDLAAVTPEVALALLENVCGDRPAWAQRCRVAADRELRWDRYASVLADTYRVAS